MTSENPMNRGLLGKAFRMEGLIKCARLAEDNDNFPALSAKGTGIAEVLEVMADLMGEISEGIETMASGVSA